MTGGRHVFFAAATCLLTGAVTAGCTGATRINAGRPSPHAARAAPSATRPPARCEPRQLAAQFAGGGYATGSDFGVIVVRNRGHRPCSLRGAVHFRAYLGGGARDDLAHVNGRLEPVREVTLRHRAAGGLRGSTLGYFVAGLQGFERDDPRQPDALCRARDEVTPAWLVLTVGSTVLRVANVDRHALGSDGEVRSVYGCHGRILMEAWRFDTAGD